MNWHAHFKTKNYLLQPWYRRRNAYGFRNHLRTEEGLAVIHQYLNKKQQLVYQSALSYLGHNYQVKPILKLFINF
jgi:ribosomal protein L34